MTFTNEVKMLVYATNSSIVPKVRIKISQSFKHVTDWNSIKTVKTEAFLAQSLQEKKYLFAARINVSGLSLKYT